MLATALDAAACAAGEGRSIEVIDLRSRVPLDSATVVGTVRRTGRCVLVHEAQATGGFGAEIAAVVQREAFDHLQSPVLRVTGFDTPYPPAKIEDFWLLDVDRILDAVEYAISH